MAFYEFAYRRLQKIAFASAGATGGTPGSPGLFTLPPSAAPALQSPVSP